MAGYEYIGGISGNGFDLFHKMCYATGTVIGQKFVGGVSGNANLNECFATGYLYGDEDCGGVLGDIETNSSSQCFWDVQTTGVDTCKTGTGLTSGEMKSAAKLKYDFTNNWIIRDGNSYPGLRCFNNHPIAGSLFDTIPANGTCTVGLSVCDAEGDSIAGYDLVTQPEFGSVVQEGAKVTYTPRKDYSGFDAFEFRAFDLNGNFSNVARVTIAVIAPFEGGDGSFGNPYRIATVNQLSSIRFHMTDSFVIENDLDFKSSLFDSSNSAQGWMPIGYQWRESFRGTIEGGNHAISNLYINRSSSNSVGLFGRIDSGWVNNLVITDCSITGNEYVGGLTGRNLGGDLTGCHISGTIYGTDCVGGIAGMSIHKTVNDWVIYGRGILRCSAEGNVRGISQVGGIAGYNTGTIIECYTTGTVSGELFAGGLAGWGGDWGGISNSYVRTSVSGNRLVGGLVGTSFNGISYCYFAGKVSGGTPIGSVSGLFGQVKACYWDRELCGLDSGYNGTARTTVEMKTMESYIAYTSDGKKLPGWDFDSIWAISPDKNDGYPCLRQQKLSIVCPAAPELLKAINRNSAVAVRSGRNGMLLVSVHVTKETKLRTAVYRIDGRKVTDLINRILPPGNYSFSFPVCHLSSGIYICRSTAGDYIDMCTFSQLK